MKMISKSPFSTADFLEEVQVFRGIGPPVPVGGTLKMADTVGIPQAVGDLNPLKADFSAGKPLNKQIGGLLLRAVGRDGESESSEQPRVSARGDGVAHLACNLALWNLGQLFRIQSVSFRPPAQGGPKFRHGDFASYKGT